MVVFYRLLSRKEAIDEKNCEEITHYGVKKPSCCLDISHFQTELEDFNENQFLRKHTIKKKLN